MPEIIKRKVYDFAHIGATEIRGGAYWGLSWVIAAKVWEVETGLAEANVWTEFLLLVNAVTLVECKRGERFSKAFMRLFKR